MPPHRRILSLWFPRLAAERALRRLRPAEPPPFAVVAEAGQMQRLAALSAEAEAAGLRRGQPLRDARAMCPALVTRPADPAAEAAFLTALRRWAGRYSPWVAEEPPDALVVDLTGCAHLFGGEAALLDRLRTETAALELTLRAAVADTLGAAWALARHAGGATAPGRSGDAIAQEARATRARAARRTAPPPAPAGGCSHIAPPGATRAALAPLPPAALRLPAATVEALARLGLRRIDALAGLPRAALARRFGRDLVQRLDQALGVEPEPVSPAGAPLHFAVRLSLPEPIGLAGDLAAALDRLVPRLCARLAERGRGARRLRLQAFRADGGVATAVLDLARPGHDAALIGRLLQMKLPEIDAGFGIDLMRLEALQTEPVHTLQHRGHLEAGIAAEAGAARLDELIARLGARIGMEAIARLHPADSHIPEKTAQIRAAAWSAPGPAPWPRPEAPRPALLLARPEPLTLPAAPPCGPAQNGQRTRATPPERFRWRRRDLVALAATGPERIAPEWWLDDPAWRSGVRDYWRVETDSGLRLWLFHAHGATASGGWFCHGIFA
jgi:protein ImuB